MSIVDARTLADKSLASWKCHTAETRSGDLTDALLNEVLVRSLKKLIQHCRWSYNVQVSVQHCWCDVMWCDVTRVCLSTDWNCSRNRWSIHFIWCTNPRLHAHFAQVHLGLASKTTYTSPVMQLSSAFCFSHFNFFLIKPFNCFYLAKSVDCFLIEPYFQKVLFVALQSRL